MSNDLLHPAYTFADEPNPYAELDAKCAKRMSCWRTERAVNTALWLAFVLLMLGTATVLLCWAM